MNLLIIASPVAIILFYLIIRKIVGNYRQKNMTDLSDANYILDKDINITRKRTLQLNQSLQELQASMEHLQVEKDSLWNRQCDLLSYPKENLKKWTDEVKN